MFEFNRLDGSLIRKVDVPKDVTAPIVCEHEGKFTALTTDPQSGRLEILEGR